MNKSNPTKQKDKQPKGYIIWTCASISLVAITLCVATSINLQSNLISPLNSDESNFQIGFNPEALYTKPTTNSNKTLSQTLTTKEQKTISQNVSRSKRIILEEANEYSESTILYHRFLR